MLFCFAWHRSSSTLIQISWTQLRFLLFVKSLCLWDVSLYPRHLAKPTCEIGWYFREVEKFLVMTIEYA